jgi:hypothetical protein
MIIDLEFVSAGDQFNVVRVTDASDLAAEIRRPVGVLTRFMRGSWQFVPTGATPSEALDVEMVQQLLDKLVALNREDRRSP